MCPIYLSRRKLITRYEIFTMSTFFIMKLIVRRVCPWAVHAASRPHLARGQLRQTRDWMAPCSHTVTEFLDIEETTKHRTSIGASSRRPGGDFFLSWRVYCMYSCTVKWPRVLAAGTCLPRLSCPPWCRRQALRTARGACQRRSATRSVHRVFTRAFFCWPCGRQQSVRS